MPPARKDSTDTDDLTRPSTSRALSPLLVPPVKRSRTSTGGPSRRQSMGGGGRQARIEDFIDEKELQDGLLLAALQTADEIMKEEEEKGNEKIEIDNEVISATARIVWDALAEDWATDLIAFSKHAGRETIREDDVKLLMRRNPLLLAEIMAECEGEDEGEGGVTSIGIKRRSTGGELFNRSRMETKEDEETDMFDTVTPRLGTSSMTSVVPETPQGIVPLAHSTPMSRNRQVVPPSFSIPSPIREEGGKRKRNGSVMEDLSVTIREGGEMDEQPYSPVVIDLRHPREQEEEERKLRMEGNEEGKLEPLLLDQSPLDYGPGPSTMQRDFGRTESPELFGHSNDGMEQKEKYDSFDDDHQEEKNNKDGGINGNVSHILSESAALREMLDEEEEEKEKTITENKKEDSFDEDSIQFVDVKTVGSPHPIGDFPSTRSVIVQKEEDVCNDACAVPTLSKTTMRSSQDSFYQDEILEDESEPVHIAAPSSVPIVKHPLSGLTVPPPAALLPTQKEDYDSFDDDDDFIGAPQSKGNMTSVNRGVSPPSPSTTVSNRWSTVSAANIFNLDHTTVQKSSPINRPSSTVPKPSPPVIHKPSPTVSKPYPAANVSASNRSTTPLSNEKKGAPLGFSFFAEESPVDKTPSVQREDSDFMETWTRQTPSTTRTARGRGGRGGRGRGFPRKIDPNSKTNRMIREQSTPVRLSPRPPSRLNEVVGLEDDDFDVSAFDD